jgi:hypothetical protein
VVAVGQRVHSCPNLEFAKGFVAGVEFANDSALRVTGCSMLRTGAFVLTLDDADYSGHEVVLPADDPVHISMEVLREE